jgi:hypothetical protein
MSDAIIAGAVAAPIAIAYVALVVAAVLQIVRDRALAGLARDPWVVAVVVVPVLGALAWFGVGHRTAAAQRAVDRVRLSL